MNTLEFKSIKGFENYKINADGSIILNKNNEPIKINITISKTKRKTCSLNKSSMNVAKAVALAFLPDPENNKLLILHKDGNSLNDHYSNLVYGDSKDQFKLLKKYNKATVFVNKTISSNYLNDEDKNAIRNLLLLGLSNSYISSLYNVSKMTVTRLKNK